MKKNLAIALNTLGNNQPAFLAINAVNQLVAKDAPVNFAFFIEDLARYVIRPLCSVMNFAEAWNYSGTIITTNMSQAIAVNRIASDINHVYYVWNLEWLEPNKQDYFYNQKAFQNTTLIARSNSHAKAIHNYSGNKPQLIVPNFNLEYIFNELGITQN